jgi:hypothetical protein
MPFAMACAFYAVATYKRLDSTINAFYTRGQFHSCQLLTKAMKYIPLLFGGRIT